MLVASVIPAIPLPYANALTVASINAAANNTFFFIRRNVFSYTKSDFDCEYIMVNLLIFKSVYIHHNLSSDVIVRAFGGVDFGVERLV